jgi:hypothetical protein
MINVNFDKQNAKSNQKRESAHSFQIRRRVKHQRHFMLSNLPT